MKSRFRTPIFLIILLAILLSFGACTEWSRSADALKGATPLEQSQSLANSINQQKEYKDFGRVVLADIDYKTGTFAYSIMVFSKFQDTQEDEGAYLKYVTMLKSVVLNTAKLEFVKRIFVVGMFADGQATIFIIDEEGLKGIRSSPKDWTKYLNQVSAQLVPTEVPSEEGGKK